MFAAHRPLLIISVLFGLVLPIASAIIYPTYMHRLEPQWLETTRLLEFPFVAAEIAVILWAMRRGLDTMTVIRTLSLDLKIALALLVLGLFIGSCVISQQPAYSLTISMITLVHLHFALAVSHLIAGGTRKDAEVFLPWHGVGLIALGIYTAWWFAGAPPDHEVPGGLIEWDSALPGFIHLRHFGSWTGAIAAAFAVAVLYSDGKKKWSAVHFFYLLAATMTVWSGTRAAVLAIVLTTLIVAVALRRLPRFEAIGQASILTGLALCLAWLLLPGDDLHNSYMFRLFNFGEAANINVLSSGRDVIWTITFQEWLTSPWFGLGSGSTLWELQMEWPHTQPHNSILQFLISWGLVGTAGALWLLARAIGSAHNQVMSVPALLPLLAMLYALLLQSLLEGMLHYPRFIIAIIILLALTTASREQDLYQEA